MKVFISWSGEQSKKIAETLKGWIKSVIQSIEPFVSSADIPKGERWSIDIAKELETTDFGILCVTKDNFNAPWLLFEAGALSKLKDKSLVAPLLFDLKPSDLTSSPLLQFQITPFSKEEIKKLMHTMNEKTQNKLDDLDKAFEKWYPDLEFALKEITSSATENGTHITNETNKKSQLLEEILSLSRDNQKLLRSSENRASEVFEQVVQRLEHISNQNDRNEEYSRRRRKISPMMLEEIFHLNKNGIDSNYGFLMGLSFFREDFPWVYDAGKELFDTLKSDKTRKQKNDAIQNFKVILERTIRFPLKFDPRRDNESIMLLRELPMVLMTLVDRMSTSDDTPKIN